MQFIMSMHHFDIVTLHNAIYLELIINLISSVLISRPESKLED